MNVLITGGNRGLGFELIKIFAATNNKVTTIIRKKSAEQQIKAKIPSCDVMVADITKIQEVSKLNLSNNNKIDLLINNAGSAGAGMSIKDTDSNEIEKQFQIHCLGAYNVIRTTYSSLSLSKNPMIINISSRLGSITRNAQGEFSGKGFSYGYRIAKGAQNMLTQCLSQELGPEGFTVCALNPGRLLTTSGASDAHMSASESAEKIYKLVVDTKLKNGGYYCIESGSMAW